MNNNIYNLIHLWIMRILLSIVLIISEPSNSKRKISAAPSLNNTYARETAIRNVCSVAFLNSFKGTRTNVGPDWCFYSAWRGRPGRLMYCYSVEIHIYKILQFINCFIISYFIYQIYLYVLLYLHNDLIHNDKITRVFKLIIHV